MICPLCGTGGADLFFADTKVAHADFLHCALCDLIFKAPDFHIGEKAEHDRYALHNNLESNDGYVRFLQPAVSAVDRVCNKGAQGLDYGCGPGPVLSELLRARGYEMQVYDPYFARTGSVLNKTYDFVTCTEVVEHFYKPDFEFSRLMSLLKDDGHLIVMTGIHRGRALFKTWHYRIDPTHVCFYSRATFEWIARLYEKQFSFNETAWPVATFSSLPD